MIEAVVEPEREDLLEGGWDCEARRGLREVRKWEREERRCLSGGRQAPEEEEESGSFDGVSIGDGDVLRCGMLRFVAVCSAVREASLLFFLFLSQKIGIKERKGDADGVKKRQLGLAGLYQICEWEITSRFRERGSVEKG